MGLGEKKLKTILVVDDEPSLLFVLEQMLEGGGHRVIGASDSRSALALFRERHSEVDVVISDLTMPGLSGEQLFNEMKQVDPKVRMLIISGYIDGNTEAALKAQGIQGFIDKPFKSAQILTALEALF